MTINDSVRIRVIRALLSMPSAAFAERMGISPGTLTAWEKGRCSPQGPKKQALAELCQENGIGFTPTGFPLPMADVLMFKPEETVNA